MVGRGIRIRKLVTAEGGGGATAAAALEPKVVEMVVEVEGRMLVERAAAAALSERGVEEGA